MFHLIPKIKYSSEESVRPENVIKHITIGVDKILKYAKQKTKCYTNNKTVKKDGISIHY